MKNPLVTNLVLLLIAFIWGFGFVPQRLGMEHLEPAAFNFLRFLLGALTVLPLLLLRKSFSDSERQSGGTLGLGILLGAILFGGATFQQISIQYTSLANVAFITGLYVIIVPIIGYFIGHRYKLIVWLGGIIAIIGMYLMTGTGGELALRGDLLALIGALFWAIHLLMLSEKAANHNQLLLSFIQFTACAALSLLMASVGEDKILPAQMIGYLWPLLNGVIVVGFAYTLQVIVMEHAEPFAASLIFSLEAVFGAIAGYLVFNERLAAAALVGAGMMLLGCVMAQLPGSQRK